MGVPIFEFVFPSIRDDGETLQSFYDQIPHIIEDTFIGAPGMHSVQVAKVLDTKGTTPQKHIGMALVLCKFCPPSSYPYLVQSTVYETDMCLSLG